jgi:hypothetical protein
MTLVSNLSDDIPGLLKAALIFNGETPGGKSASLAILTDGDAETLIDLSAGLNARGDGLTQAMRSYISGLSQVGQVLKARKIEDEDGVTEDDLERAALLFAFPKVGQNAKALTILKAHLDALQDHGIVAKADGSSPVAKPKPKVEARQEPDQDASDDAEADQTDDDETVIEQVAEAASPLTLVGGGAAAAVAAVLDKDDAASDDEDDDTEMSADADETEDVGDEEEEEVSASADDIEVEADDEGDEEEEEDAVKADAPPRPSPAQIAQARLNNAPRKPSFFGR